MLTEVSAASVPSVVPGTIAMVGSPMYRSKTTATSSGIEHAAFHEIVTPVVLLPAYTSLGSDGFVVMITFGLSHHGFGGQISLGWVSMRSHPLGSLAAMLGSVISCL